MSDLYENPFLYQGKFVCLFVAEGRKGVKVWSLAAPLSSKSNLKQLLCSYFMILCHKRGGTESGVELAHLRIDADFQHVQWENNFFLLCLPSLQDLPGGQQRYLLEEAKITSLEKSSLWIWDCHLYQGSSLLTEMGDMRSSNTRKAI